jgi:integrase/recombinase XerD
MVDPLEIIQNFINYIETNEGLSTSTGDKYMGYLVRLNQYCIDNDLQLLRLDTERAEHFTGLHLHELGLAPRSRKAVVSCVRKFYAWCFKKGLIDEDPARELTQPKAGRRIGNKIELDNMEKLIMAPGLDTFLGLRDTAIISVLSGCGLRASGLVSLNESSLIFVKEKEREKLYLKLIEKEDKQRIVPAPNEVWALIRAYLGHPELNEFDRSLEDGDKVLFVKTRDRTIPLNEFHGDNTRLKRKAINNLINKYGALTGIPSDQLGPHAMRHLYGTELTEDNVDVAVRQELMGHEDIKSQAIYNHMAMRKLRKEVDRANPLSKINTPVTDLIKEL